MFYNLTTWGYFRDEKINQENVEVSKAIGSSYQEYQPKSLSKMKPRIDKHRPTPFLIITSTSPVLETFLWIADIEIHPGPRVWTCYVWKNRQNATWNVRYVTAVTNGTAVISDGPHWQMPQ